MGGCLVVLVKGEERGWIEGWLAEIDGLSVWLLSVLICFS